MLVDFIMQIKSKASSKIRFFKLQLDAKLTPQEDYRYEFPEIQQLNCLTLDQKESVQHIEQISMRRDKDDMLATVYLKELLCANDEIVDRVASSLLGAVDWQEITIQC